MTARMYTVHGYVICFDEAAMSKELSVTLTHVIDVDRKYSIASYCIARNLLPSNRTTNITMT